MIPFTRLIATEHTMKHKPVRCSVERTSAVKNPLSMRRSDGLAPGLHEPIHEMGAYESGAARDSALTMRILWRKT
jgi:hypothetical protein